MNTKSMKRTKLTEFRSEAREKIKARDGGCIFCKMGFKTDGAGYFELNNFQIMHYVPRSQGGLGIPENGAVGCLYHHNLLDNGRNTRKEMLQLFEDYLKEQYPNWDKKKLLFRKGSQ